MSAGTDRVARKALAKVPTGPLQVRQAARVTKLGWVPISSTMQAWTLFADFGSGGVQVAAIQSVLDDLQARDNASPGSAQDWVVGQMAITVTPPGNGMPIVVGFVGSITTAIP